MDYVILNNNTTLKEKIDYVENLGNRDATLNLLINLENQGLGDISITKVLDEIANKTTIELPNRNRVTK